MSALPTSWASCSLLECADFVRGVTYTKSDALSASNAGTIPILRANNIQAQAFDWNDLVHVPETLVSKGQELQIGDVVIATSSGSLSVVGKAAQVRSEIRASFGAFCGVLRPHPYIQARYYGHFFSSAHYRSAVSDLARGVNINNLKRDHFQAIQIPLAPLAEQKRVADKLDTVLTRVDAVNTRLARVAPMLKRFRQSVLAAATSGRLTEDWRKTKAGAVALEYQSIELTIPYAHAITAPKVWTAMRFDEAIDLVGGSQPPKAVFSDVEQDGYVRLIQIRDYKSDKYKTHIPRELARRFCSSSDVMIGRYGPPIFQILRGLEGAYNVALMKAVPRQDIYSNDYLFYFLQKPDLLRYVEAGSDRTAGQDGVNKDHLIKYPVFAPPIEEQTEIVRRVETLFAFADRLEARLAQAQTAATRLTPALLAKAFRGELVPQDPNDEPAAELLRRLAQKPSAPAKQGRNTKVI